MTYTEFKQQKTSEYNALPIKYAFGEQQQKEMIKAFGLENELNPYSFISRIGMGGYILTKDLPMLKEFNDKWEKVAKACYEDLGFVTSMFYKELWNHEYIYSEDDDEILRACGISFDEFQNNKTYQLAMRIAKRNYFDKAEA